MFYVYEWFIKETNEIIYVGKGIKNRYKVKKHNQLFNEMIKRFDCDSRIVKEFDNEKEAFEYEYQRINELWEIKQCVCNIYKGGMGGTIDWWTKEKRDWYSKNNCMKTKKQRERMSKNNPMKNKEIALKVNNKKKKKVIINDIKYDSILSACKKYNVSYETIKNWCNKGINNFGELCRYENQKQVYFIGNRYNKGSCKEIIYKNKIYESPIDLAKELNINKHIIYRWAKKGFDNQGVSCKYLNDNRILTYKPYINGIDKRKPIKVNGIIYSSKKEAEEKLGIKGGGLTPYIKGIRKNNKFICEYVNQQPSHENSDKSIVEGSTTNE